jgi:glycosyltransferase involved in cell wall biosynthesis
MAVRDEEPHLEDAVARILAQGYPGELELVIAVAPSKDATAEVAHRMAARDARLCVVDNPAGITPAGLNLAIAAARHDVLVRVDGHSFLPEAYVERVVTALLETGADNVGGVMAASGVTAFEQAVATAMRSPLGIGGARFHTGGDPGPAETVYLGTFRRSALERVGGYDERFVRAQDWELNFRIRETGGTVWFTPDLEVGYRPRSGLRPLARQFFHTGRWRRYVARTHPSSISARYLAPPLAFLGVVLGLVAAPFFWPAVVLPVGYLVLVLAGSVWIGRGQRVAVLALLPLVITTMHMCWGLGFLLGPPRATRSVSSSGG